MIKKRFKLNINLAKPKRGIANYNLCSKYDYIFKTLAHNMNCITKHTDRDGTIDESLWGFGVYMGECSSCLIGKLVPKVFQIKFWMDIHCRYPRAYINCHKLQTLPVGFNAYGPAEVVQLVSMIDDLIDGTDPGCTVIKIPKTIDEWRYPTRKIYPSPPSCHCR
jgi:hypothetical protein